MKIKFLSDGDAPCCGAFKKGDIREVADADAAMFVAYGLAALVDEPRKKTAKAEVSDG